MNKIIAVLFGVCILFSCHQKDREVDADSLLGYDYYPLDSGRYWIYAVHVLDYNATNLDTTYQVKEVIYDTFHFTNQVFYTIYRFYREDDLSAWPIQPDSVWTVTRDANQLSIKENNIEYIRLCFPMKSGNRWDGNAKNAFGEEKYTLKNVGGSYSYDSYNYPQTVRAEESNVTSFVNKDVRNIVYAKDIGPVYKKYESLTYKSDVGSIGQFIIEYGHIVEQKLIDYGKP